MKVIYEYFMRLLEFIPEHDEFEKFLHAILLYLVLYMIYMGLTIMVTMATVYMQKHLKIVQIDNFVAKISHD